MLDIKKKLKQEMLIFKLTLPTVSRVTGLIWLM